MSAEMNNLIRTAVLPVMIAPYLLLQCARLSFLQCNIIKHTLVEEVLRYIYLFIFCI